MYAIINIDCFSYEAPVRTERRVLIAFSLCRLQDCRGRVNIEICRLLHFRKKLFLYPPAHLPSTPQVHSRRPHTQQDPSE